MSLPALESCEQLPLFGPVRGSNVARLKRRIESLSGPPRAGNTARGYASDWRSFVAWCDGEGRKALPASEETVCIYVTAQLDDDAKKVNTALRRLSAIIDAHRVAGVPVPAVTRARYTIRRIRDERREKPNRKTAVSPEHLRNMVRCCDATTARGCRNRAIIVLGFATALRRSELAALQLSDVTFQPEGLGVFVQRSKNDQAGKGRPLGAWPGTREETDPLNAVRAWIEKRGTWDGPLFCRVRGKNSVCRAELNGRAIAEVVKTAAESIKLDPSRYAGHSLRSGFVTASVHLGRTDIEIARTTGHVNLEEVRTYFRDAVFLGRNPLEGVL